MPYIIDLTRPVQDHFRWPVRRELKADFAAGDPFQVTWIGWTVHGFTHVDAPRHIDPNGATTTETPISQLVGDAAVIDLSGVAPNAEIDAAILEGAGGHVQPDDIVLVKTRWDEAADIETPAFWTTAPYLTRDAAEWLFANRPKAVGFDFPQDYPIRLLLSGERRPMSEFVTHDALLRNGVILIEYLCNLGAIETPRTTVYALPTKLLDADGAPARVIAIQPEDTA